MDLQALKRDVENIALACLQRKVHVRITGQTLEVDDGFLLIPEGARITVGQVHILPTPEGQAEEIETLGQFSRAEAITTVMTEIFRSDFLQDLEDKAMAEAFGQG